MSNKFWKMMDQLFLILIEVTGEKQIQQEKNSTKF